MAKNSIIEYTGDGSTIQYTINFTGGYTLEAHVFCRVNDEVDGSGDPIYRSLTFISEGLVEIGGAVPALGEKIVFQRVTPVDAPVVDFEDGVTFTEEDIDAGFEQVLFGIQEAQDNLADAEDTEAAKIAAETAQAAAELAQASAEAAVVEAESAVADAESAETDALAAQAAAEASAAAAALSVASIASNTISIDGSTSINLATHSYNLFRFHTSTGTANLGSASTMGDTFTCFIKADGIDVTINPDGAELINGVASLELVDGQSAKLYCDGAAWQAVLIGAGSGGGITYEEKTTAYTAEAGDGIGANTTGGAFTITLPESPSVGDVVIVADTHGQWATNNLTVARNGENIQRVAEDLVCDIANIQIELVYFSNGWIAYPSGNVVGTVPLYASNNLNDVGDAPASRGNLNTWVDKTAAYTMVAGDWIYADTSGGAFTLTLPASPSEGEEVKVADPNTAWATNSVTIARNGNNIAGNADDMECSTGAVTHIFTFDSSTGNWRVQTLSVSGGDYGNAPRQLLQTITIGSDASIDITGINSGYDKYEIELIGVVISSDGQSVRMRTSSDGGTTFDSGASDYRQIGHTVRHSGSTGSASELYYSVVDDWVQLNYGAGVGNASAERFNCVVEIFTPSETAPYCTGHFRTIYQYSVDGTLCKADYAWERRTGNIVDAVQFLTPVGTFTSGTIKVYGVR